MAQVKFYSVDALPAKIDAGGIYFVGGKEIYKGSTRFGAGRVTTKDYVGETLTVDGAISGDINISTQKGAEVYDGENWKPLSDASLTAKVSALETWKAGAQSSWRADIKDWTAGLVKGGEGSIITGITQDADGKVTATATKFPAITSPADGVVSLAGTSVKVSGWDTLAKESVVSGSITTLGNRVSAIETWKSSITGDTVIAGTKVTAETGNFKNLTVTDTANFTATTISATTLSVATESAATFGGNTISAIADR